MDFTHGRTSAYVRSDIGAAQAALYAAEIFLVHVEVVVGVGQDAGRIELVYSGSGQAAQEGGHIVVIHVGVVVQVAGRHRQGVRNADRARCGERRLEGEVAIPEEVRAQNAVERASFRRLSIEDDERGP